MSGTRANIYNLPVIDTDHRTAGTSKNTHIQRADICIMSANLSIIHTGTTIFNDADIGSGSAYLKVNSIGSTQIHKRTHNRSGRA